ASPRLYKVLNIKNSGGLLCDWQSVLSAGTPTPDMCTSDPTSVRYMGVRLVVVKSLENYTSWEECQGTRELEALRSIPPHPNITALYDSFFDTASLRLHLVLEPLEGNAYELIRLRKGRPFAHGLLLSIASQITAGLRHIHATGFVHGSVSPESIMITTTGLQDYTDLELPGASRKDITLLAKVGNFAYAHRVDGVRVDSMSPGAPLVWYLPPELLFPCFSTPEADMWAFGLVLVELICAQVFLP
ncbi:kinase-like domain-containing protein, partial [Vararia minispora EC-137]